MIETLEKRIAPSTLVTLAGGSLSVQGDAGGAGEVESLFITVAGKYLRISDPDHPISAGSGVHELDAHTLLVPFASLHGAVSISTGSGADSIHIDGALPALTGFAVTAEDAGSSLTMTGSIHARDGHGHGGSIALTAGKIELHGGTLDANGPLGGGTILVGGGFQGGGSL